MRCAWIQDRLLPYLMGELESPQAARIVRHLESCERCARLAEELAETKDWARGVIRTRIPLPSGFDERVMARVRNLPSSRLTWTTPPPLPNWRRGLLYACAAACLVLLGFLLGRWQAENDPTRVVEPESAARPVLSLTNLADDHVKYLAYPRPAQIPGPGPQRVSQGLSPLVQFSVAAVDLQREGARLLGGRKCQAHGHPIAFLLYDWRGERVSLYQIDGHKLALPPLREIVYRDCHFLVGEVNGLTFVAWRSGAMCFVMVSGATRDRLLPLARCASEPPDRL